MKSIKSTLIIGVLFLTPNLFSQDKSEGSEFSYKTAIGIRAGGQSGITIKHFVKSKHAIEGIISTGWFYRSFRFTGLYEFHKSFSEIKGLDWFAGIGGHIGSYPGKYYGYYGYHDGGYYDKHGNWHPTGYRANYLALGIDVILGLEYEFEEIPFTIGIDVKPFVDLFGGAGGFLDGALSFRYILK